MTTTEYRIYRTADGTERMESIFFDSRAADASMRRLRDQNPDHAFRLERLDFDHGPDEVTT